MQPRQPPEAGERVPSEVIQGPIPFFHYYHTVFHLLIYTADTEIQDFHQRNRTEVKSTTDLSTGVGLHKHTIIIILSQVTIRNQKKNVPQ